MANYSVPSGTSSYGNTLTANTADAVTFADRYGYVTVTNLGTTGVIYVTTNGIAPTDTAGENGSSAVMPGQSLLVSVADALWYQSQKVIPAGVIEMGNGNAYNATTNPSTPTQPGHVTYGRSLGGQVATDGIVVGLISTSANSYVIAAAG
jgi:hypothetical protein